MPVKLVEMTNINKSFPGVKALDDVKFDMVRGEVHGLIGENGAGKSTLMKILTGVYKKDTGSVKLEGKEISTPNPRSAQLLGISIMHQELQLVPHLSIAENIFIGREKKQKFPLFLDDRAINEEAKKYLDMLHLDIEPTTKVSKLTVAKQQMVELAKALSFDAKVLIMDEPTAALSDNEIEDLFHIINKLKKQGVGIVYISHRMDELKRICDRVTVMRDGQYIDTVDINAVSLDEIIKMMVGREIYVSSTEVDRSHHGDVILEVKGLNQGKTLKDISFSLKKGEILGLAGLMGAGRTEAMRAIFGADKIDSGEVFVSGKKVHIKSPKEAVKHGVGYLSEDRKQFGLAVKLDVKDNIVLSSLEKFSNAMGMVNSKKVEAEGDKMVELLSVRTPSIKQKVKNLSGGNQQKVVVCKWLTRDCDILIFDEPTRGIDVGAKGEIYKLMNQLVKEGKSIIMISSELPEILRMSHRVITMCEGKITGELDIEEATQESIMKFATMRD
jgi:ribose transport system ATP-binding protein